MLNGKAVAALLAAAVLTGGCAAAVPGYVPEGSRKSLTERSKPFEGGAVQSSGAYAVSDAERALDCKRLRGSMIIIVSKLRDTGKGPAPSLASSTIQSGVSVVRGKALMMEPTAEAKRERARLDAYNGLLAEKQCPVMDIEAELAGQSTPAPPAKPKTR